MNNSGHLGVVYSKNPDLIEAFRKFKATKGMVTSTGADRGILRAIEATTPGFHERNRALMASTGTIAVGLAEAAELSKDATHEGFTVTFPALEDHPDHEYVTEHLHEGVSPVVFMACKGFDPELARQLLIRVSEHPRIREQIKEGQISLGQSFGFDTARLLYDQHASYVRVAGGYNIDSDALADALKEAAADV
jgi:aspartate/methionine/tyrosine aminotransferase